MANPQTNFKSNYYSQVLNNDNPDQYTHTFTVISPYNESNIYIKNLDTTRRITDVSCVQRFLVER